VFDPVNIKINKSWIIVSHSNGADITWEYVSLADNINPFMWCITVFKPFKFEINKDFWFRNYTPRILIGRYKMHKIRKELNIK